MERRITRPHELDPLLASRRICEDYQRYVQAAFPLKHSGLRHEFSRLIRRPGFLVKGPFLEGTPPFKGGASISALIERRTMCASVKRLEGPGFPGPGYPTIRRLYLHQEEAIEKILAGRNLVVATGTGSGKTETFLLPILDYLLREAECGTLSAPGVRALLLYPMNALANDQLKRLRRLLANVPEITFGRYTGQTPDHRAKAESDFAQIFPDEPRIENELICRDDIRERPPHILLTNYAMLEYLLLRPQDTTLFDGHTGDHWAFIVIDEAHTYAGAAGIEVAMLLRRLKDRVVTSRPGVIRCVATSATLGRGKRDFPQVTQFASHLFGERFEWNESNPERQDVVEASHESLDVLHNTWGSLPSAAYERLVHSKYDLDSLLALVQKNHVPLQVVDCSKEASKGDPSAFLYHVLKGDGRVHRLCEVLRDRALPLPVVSESVFGDRSEESLGALVALVSLCAKARPTRESASLAPARYHLFARALEGGFVTFPDGENPRLYLESVNAVEEEGHKCQSFEIAACTRCGQVFLVGQILQSETRHLHTRNSSVTRLLRSATRWFLDDASHEAQFFLWDTSRTSPPDEDEFAFAKEDAAPIRLARWTLCVQCGAIRAGDTGTGCDCESDRHISVFEAPRKDGNLTTCPACGAHTAFADIAQRLLTGQDAPVAVLATSMYQCLPPEPLAEGPGQGRKLLIFSDSRQDAAYFAPYLEATHDGLLRRRLLLQAVEMHQNRHGCVPARPDGLCKTYLGDATRRCNFFGGPADPAREHKERCTWVFQELLGVQRRIGLEGTGLLAVTYTRPDNWTAPRALSLTPWQLTPAETWCLVQTLLDTVRLSGGVCVEPADVKSPAFAPRNRLVFFRETGASANRDINIQGWLPDRSRHDHVSNRRFDFLSRLLESRSGESASHGAITEVLREIWRSLTRTELLKSTLVKRDGACFQIEPRYIELHHGSSRAIQWYRCSLCGALSVTPVGQVCLTMGCLGTMMPVNIDSELGGQHYRELYRRMTPIPMRVREHTAQWSPQKAAALQQDFVDGRLNVLSCSTTFELGVDVGELQAVLMRNVPPSTARYVQRAGRAGRRTDAAAFAVTYAQRRPHDLAHYTHPDEFISGRIKPPVLQLSNPKIIRRHVHAVALSEFFRRCPERFSNVEAFFGEKPGEHSGPSLLRAMLAEKPAALRSQLARIVPDDGGVREELGIDCWKWVAMLLDDQSGVLSRAASEVHFDLGEYRKLEQEASKRGEHRRAYFFQRHGNRVRQRQLIGFLASRNVLPKYGFPVDVVELQLTAPDSVAQELELQRDLRIAISEYAPGGQIVAGHRIWESTGIRKLPHREPDEFFYTICPRCGRFHKSIVLKGTPKTCLACQQPLAAAGTREGRLVVPEFGFFGNKDSIEVGPSRPRRLFSSRVFFSEYAKDAAQDDCIFYRQPTSGKGYQLTYRFSKQGELAVVNSGIAGRGFWVCQECGFTEPVVLRREKTRGYEHQNAYGRDCRGTREIRHLGHRFQTDVLELRFQCASHWNPDNRLWWSLTYALLDGASDALGIERQDLDGCLYPNAPASHPPAIILYDDIPGGAGYVQRVAGNLDAVLPTARARVESCTCAPDTACYACLKTYNNQFCHNQLARGIVAEFLSRLLSC